ncbi:MAG TPA: hypothetical protein VK395_14185 [Gemmataceae bacterium]|nr:hypothetical protein [Gemmataceae bacterium]
MRQKHAESTPLGAQILVVHIPVHHDCKHISPTRERGILLAIPSHCLRYRFESAHQTTVTIKKTLQQLRACLTEAAESQGIAQILTPGVPRQQL